ncbi:MAG: NAD(P)H-binding protein [Weeksellaceae bacterium]|nr:NAD(P)H-binding protein [Weeksellaceae bacterium]
MKKALIIGGSGATGKELVKLLLQDRDYTEIVLFLRSPLDFHHNKLTTHIIDFDKVEEWQDLVKGDVLFSALGTTLKQAGGKKKQWTVDYDYQYNFAEIAASNGVKNYVLVSATNAHAKSPFFYSKMKGQLEEAVQELGFERVSIFQPPILERFRDDRTLEGMAVKTVKAVNKIGLFKIWKPLPVTELAEAMRIAAKTQVESVMTYTPADIKNLVTNQSV